MFHLLHGVTNQELLKKPLCNQSSCYTEIIQMISAFSAQGIQYTLPLNQVIVSTYCNTSTVAIVIGDKIQIRPNSEKNQACSMNRGRVMLGRRHHSVNTLISQKSAWACTFRDYAKLTLPSYCKGKVP